MSIGPDFWRVVLIAAVIILAFTATNAARRNRDSSQARRQRAVRSMARAQAMLDHMRDRIGGPRNA